MKTTLFVDDNISKADVAQLANLVSTRLDPSEYHPMASSCACVPRWMVGIDALGALRGAGRQRYAAQQSVSL